MESLQIQDTFRPYHAERPKAAEGARQERPKAALAVSKADVRARLLVCRDRLARAIAAVDGKEH